MSQQDWQVSAGQRGFARMLPGLVGGIWLVLIVWIGFWQGLLQMELLDETEPMFVEAARQMHLTGDWLTPMFNGSPRFDKPPLIYWLMAMGFRIFGVSPWAAKLASVLPATMVVVIIFYFLQWLRCDWSAPNRQPSLAMTPSTSVVPSIEQRLCAVVPYLGSAIAALNLQMYFFGRLGYSDMLLNLCISSGLISFFCAYSQPQRPLRQRALYLLWFSAMGCGVLTKGPVAIVLPGLIIAAFLCLMGDFWRVFRREIPWLWGLGLMLFIAVPWYAWMVQVHGSQFIAAFFGFHNVQRFTQVVNQHTGPWYYHFLILLPGLLPWSAALPAAIWQACRRPLRPQRRSQRIGYFALIWFVVVMGFFTIASTKYLTYSLPALPAAVLLLALWWNDVLTRRAIGLRFSNYLTLALFAGLAAAAWYCPNWLNSDPSMPGLGQAVAAAQLPQIGAAVWGVSALFGCLFVERPNFWRLKVLTAAAFVLLFVTPAFQMLDQVRQLPLRQVAAVIQQQRQPQEVVAMGTGSFGKPSLLFYSQQNLALMRRSHEIPAYLAALRRQVSPPTSVLLVTTDATLQSAKIVPADYQLVEQVGIYQIVRIPLTRSPQM